MTHPARSHRYQPDHQITDQFHDRFDYQGWVLLDPVFSPAECDQIVAHDADRSYPATTPALRTCDRSPLGRPGDRPG